MYLTQNDHKFPVLSMPKPLTDKKYWVHLRGGRTIIDRSLTDPDMIWLHEDPHYVFRPYTFTIIHEDGKRDRYKVPFIVFSEEWLHDILTTLRNDDLSNVYVQYEAKKTIYRCKEEKYFNLMYKMIEGKYDDEETIRRLIGDAFYDEKERRDRISRQMHSTRMHGCRKDCAVYL